MVVAVPFVTFTIDQLEARVIGHVGAASIASSQYKC
jgi:hypothetical protein